MPSLQLGTEVACLLCAHTGNEPAAPLAQREYVQLLQWLRERHHPIEALLEPGVSSLLGEIAESTSLDSERLAALLRRGSQIALWLERWTNVGMWIASWEDVEYPPILRQKLGDASPVLLHGFGNPQLLQTRGLAIVGSRHTSEALLQQAYAIASRCASHRENVISGGARGVDSFAMKGALEEGGTCVGVLAADLARTATSHTLRDYLLTDKLCLVSPYHPQAGFTAGNAMGRNKIIYALAEFALVIASDMGKGGTWAGALENLRAGWTPLFVYTGNDAPEGNMALRDAGAYPFTLPEDAQISVLSHLRHSLASTSAPTSSRPRKRQSTVSQPALPLDTG
jgi:predicted Rossmann fold nucleotide-binding protein DprA/Smf involved in DNA uptake